MLFLRPGRDSDGIQALKLRPTCRRAAAIENDLYSRAIWSTMTNWIRRSKAGSLPEPAGSPTRRPVSELEVENARLRRELADDPASVPRASDC
jgi:hypothetical protein